MRIRSHSYFELTIGALDVKIQEILTWIVEITHSNTRHALILHSSLGDCKSSHSINDICSNIHRTHSHFLRCVDHKSIVGRGRSIPSLTSKHHKDFNKYNLQIKKEVPLTDDGFSYNWLLLHWIDLFIFFSSQIWSYFEFV